MSKNNYEEILNKILDACKKEGKAIQVKDLKKYDITTDIKLINKYLKESTIYDNYKDFCRENGFLYEYDIIIGNKCILKENITIEDLKILWQECKEKYNILLGSKACNEYAKQWHIPRWNVIQKTLKKNNLSIDDFYIYIGVKCQFRDVSRYNLYLEQFIKISNELGRPIKSYELIKNNWNLPSSRWFVTNCPNNKVKDYNQFLEWINYKPNFHVSKEKAIEIILNMQSKLNRPLMYDDFKNPNINEIGIGTIKKIWGSMNKMKKDLKLEIIQEDMKAKHKNRDELLKDLKDFINKLGRLPNSYEIDDNFDMLNRTAYNREFGGISNAFNLLGYIPNKKSISFHLSNKEIKEIYKDYIEDNGFVPSFDFCKDIYKLPSPITVLRRLNCTWNEFIINLGYKPNTSIATTCICYAKDGTKCLSSAECLIHNFLLTKSINNFDKEVFYRDILENEKLIKRSGYKRLDWTFIYNNNLYLLEYFGMMSDKKYELRHNEKIKLIKEDNKLDNFIALYPKDLKHLNEIFSFIK